MDMKTYMDKDLHRIEELVTELFTHIATWDSDKVFETAKEMFDVFSRRFHLEDSLLCKIAPNPEMSPGIQKFLKRRLELRKVLENILTLHADEPDFRNEIRHVIEMVKKHIKYRESEFYPEVINRLPAADLERMKKALEARRHIEL